MISRARLGVACAALMLAAGLAGCASPGLPKPPSLELPTPVTDLEAAREGSTVTVRFTTPKKTTDKLPIRGTMMASLCRQEVGGACRAVVQQSVPVDKEIAMTDRLPPVLAEGGPVLLTYRVMLVNAKGRTAGPSNEAYVAGGSTPAVVADLTAAPGPEGAVVRWRAVRGSDWVELERRHVAKPGAAAKAKTGGPLAAPKEPEVVRLRGGESDAGGTVDAGAKPGESYDYAAWRVRRLTLAGHAVELRSAASPTVMVEMRDVFPPAVPRGLVAAPAGTGVDLSWEADTEADLAGYFVYRVTVGGDAAAVKLNAAPVAGPAYHDASAAAGVPYRYMVSAVDESGNESGRSAAVEAGIQ